LILGNILNNLDYSSILKFISERYLYELNSSSSIVTLINNTVRDSERKGNSKILKNKIHSSFDTILNDKSLRSTKYEVRSTKYEVLLKNNN
jgi:hypothetical protein